MAVWFTAVCYYNKNEKKKYENRIKKERKNVNIIEIKAGKNVENVIKKAGKNVDKRNDVCV